MGEIFPAEETNDELSIERCRELLGDETIDLTDDDVDRIRICADSRCSFRTGFASRGTSLVEPA